MEIMAKKYLLIIPLIALVGFLFFPKIGLADDFENITPEEAGKYLELPGKDAEKILSTLIQVLTTKGINLLSSADASDEEIAVVGILRGVVRIDVLNHLLIDAPIEVTGKIIKSAVEIARLFGAQDISVVLDKFEKETVKMAVDYGMKVLFQNEIRVTPGAIKFGYNSCQGEKKEVVFQYIIIYQPLDAESGKVEIRFYSPNPIEPPGRKGSIGGIWGIYHDLQHDLPPFITEISGEVEKTDLGAYRWIRGPSIKITFPDSVPDFGIKPLTFWERHLLKPIETAIKNIEVIITKVTGKSLGIVDIWDKIKAAFSRFNPFGPAAVVETQLVEGEELEVEELSVGAGQEVSEEPETEPELILDEEASGDREAEEKEEEIMEEEIEEPKQIEEEEPEEDEEETEPEETPITICEKTPGNSPVRDKVIINEIAWVGTVGSYNDEWIELKNISGNEINLIGWQLLDEEKQIKIIFEEEVIPAGGFFLLERTDDDSIPNIAADFIYTGSLSNTEEALYLFDKNCHLQDEVMANPDWPAGDNSSKRTMERKNNLEWQTSSEAGGTPKRENSGGYYEHQGGGYSPPPPPEPVCDSENIDLCITQELCEEANLYWYSETCNLDVEPEPESEPEPEPEPEPKPVCDSENIDLCTTQELCEGASLYWYNETCNLVTEPEPEEILITEIQIGAEGDEKEEFVELYNPNETDVNLTGWYMQRKTETGSEYLSFAPSALFSEKIIQAKDYFLIARQDSSFTSLADIIIDDPLTANNSLVLKNQNKIIIDEFNWPEVPAGQSYGRKWDETSQTYLDDFELQTPTPKAKNQPLPPVPPELIYLSAISYSDPEDRWQDETLAYDGDKYLNTFASVSVCGVSRSAWLELLSPKEESSGIRFWIDSISELCHFWIELFYDGGWYYLKGWPSGSLCPAKGEWVVVDYPEKKVEKARCYFYRGSISSGCSQGYLNEFQFKTYE